MSHLMTSVRELMAEKGWNGQILAKRSNQKLSDIYNILSGKSKKPSADKVESIARAFGVSISKLLYGMQDQPNFVKPDEEWDGLLYSEAMGVVQDIYKKRGITFRNREEEKNAVMHFTMRVYNYAKNMAYEVGVIAHSCGVDDPRELTRAHARVVTEHGQSISLAKLYTEYS